MAQRAADQVTLIDLTDGVSVILSSESYSFPGTTSAAIAGSTTTKIQALMGDVYVPATVDVAAITKPAGVTVTKDTSTTAPTLTISVANTVTAPGEVVIPVVVGELTIEKRFSFSIAFKGTTGADGATGATGAGATSVIQGIDAIALPTDLSGNTTSASTITIPFAGYIGANRAAATVAVSGLPTGITAGTNTAATTSADGSLILNVASASNLGGNDTGVITLTYTVNGLTFIRRLTWAKAKQGSTGATGATGTSATLADLRNEAFVVTTDVNGSTVAATTVNIPFGAYLGNARIAATAAVGTLPAGMTAGTIVAATTSADGTVPINIASGSTLGGTNDGFFVVTVTANGIAFPMVVSWSKSKQGAQGAAGVNATTSGLFNEAQMIPTDANGLTIAAQTINVNFFGYVGSSRAAVTAAVGTLPTGITVGTNTPGTTSADGVLTLQVAAGSDLGGVLNGTIPITLTVNSIARPFSFSWSKSQQGSPGITLEVTSSGGLVFKNTAVATVLTAKVYAAGVEQTGAALTALGTIKWYKNGTYLTGKDGATLTIAAGDVLDSATYEARLEN